MLDVIRVGRGDPDDRAVWRIRPVSAYSRAGPLLGCAVRSPQSGWEEYVFAAWGWLVVGLVLGPRRTIVRLFTGGAESCSCSTWPVTRSDSVSPRKWCWAWQAASSRTSPANRYGAPARAMPRSIC